jgi:hypothetical protein
MATTRKKSLGGLLSEAGKKGTLGAGDGLRKLAGKRPTGKKSPSGNLSEAVKKAGRGVGRAANKVVE